MKSIEFKPIGISTDCLITTYDLLEFTMMGMHILESYTQSCHYGGMDLGLGVAVTDIGWQMGLKSCWIAW